jgi:predicted glycoside hydrolase/deacetylase ChbG (UPF0249 family)
MNMTQKSKILIPRADDAGSSPEANRAIYRTCKEGWMRNVGFMAPTPWFREAVDLIGQLPGIAHGLHVTFTNEWTLNAWKSMTGVQPWTDEEGRCMDSPMSIFQRGVVIDAMVAEIRAQLAWARSSGLKIVYMDGHMGIEWVHPLNDPAHRLATYLQEICDEEGIVWHLNCYRTNAPQGPSIPDRQPFLRNWLSEREGQILLMTHPATDTGFIHADSFRPANGAQLGNEQKWRQSDLDLLCDNAFADQLKQDGWNILRFDETPQTFRGIDPYAKVNN